MVGWLNTKVFDETGDAAKAQGWSPLVLDTNGNGKRDDYVEPNQPVDPSKDKRIDGRHLRGDAEPGGRLGLVHRRRVRRQRSCDSCGSTRPTELAEIYNVPMPGFGPRGGDIDKKGVVWVSLGSGHLGSFDRRKCKGPLNGPKATGDHCPEGWTFYQYPGPGFAGIGENSAEASYYTWVDQHNTLGLGDDVPISTGNENDALVGAGGREMGGAARPVPAGLLCQGLGRPHRRSECRLEGPRRVDDERRSHAVAEGRRQGHRADRLPLPAAPGPVGGVTLSHSAAQQKKAPRHRR